MKKALSIFLLSLIVSNSLKAQDNSGSSTEGSTSFFAELGGPGILFSANMDKRFNKTRFGFGGRAGVGFVSLFQDDYNSGTGSYNGRQISVATFPLQLNYVFGKGTSPHTFEVGAGVTIAGRKLDIFNYYNDSRLSSVFGTASFMYRRQPVNGGFSWRAGFTPIIGSGYIQPSAGLSVGYNF